MIINNRVTNLLTYFLISKKIMNENKIVMEKNVIIESLVKFNINKTNKQIVKKGINAKILFILVFLDVKTFKP